MAGPASRDATPAGCPGAAVHGSQSGLCWEDTLQGAVVAHRRCRAAAARRAAGAGACILQQACLWLSLVPAPVCSAPLLTCLAYSGCIYRWRHQELLQRKSETWKTELGRHNDDCGDMRGLTLQSVRPAGLRRRRRSARASAGCSAGEGTGGGGAALGAGRAPSSAGARAQEVAGDAPAAPPLRSTSAARQAGQHPARRRGWGCASTWQPATALGQSLPFMSCNAQTHNSLPPTQPPSGLPSRPRRMLRPAAPFELRSASHVVAAPRTTKQGASRAAEGPKTRGALNSAAA